MPTYTGTNRSETIIGSDGTDSIYGLDGNDRLVTLDGGDFADGGNGDDEINAFFSASDSGFLVYPNSGSKRLLGGNGNDTIHGSKDPDTILGEMGNDHLAGDTADDSIYGGEGDDTIHGNSGADTLRGGADNDELDGSDESDLLDGGAGNDKLLDQATGDDTLLGGDGDDDLNTYTGTGNKQLDGGNGNDTLLAGLGNDTLNGGIDDDYLAGSGGDDIYFIDSLRDSIYDESGNDKALVSANWVKIPVSIESVDFQGGVQRIPYWIDALIPGSASGSYFNSLVGPSRLMYYAFPSSPPAHDVGTGRDVGYTALNANQRVQVRKVLDYFQSLIDLQFVETTDVSRLNSSNFAYNNPGFVGGYAFEPMKAPSGSDVFMSVDPSTQSLAIDSFGLGVLMHEFGHALGLKHPTDTKFENPNAMDEGPFVPDSEAKTSVTIMGQKVKDVSGFKIAIGPFDVAALQYLYGPSKAARVGDDTYALKTTEANFIWDGVGIDTVSAEVASQPITLYLEPGYWSYFGASKASTMTAPGQVTINFGSEIENAIGSGYSDKVFGSAIANFIKGGDGNDTILGAGGNDSLEGGNGDDRLEGGAGTDVGIYKGVRGSYTVEANRDGIISTVFGGPIIQIFPPPLTEGTDTLLSIERLQFADKTLAFDTGGNAGMVAKTLGAVFGKTAIANAQYAGIGLYFADALAYSSLQLMQLAIEARLGGNPSHAAVVDLLYTNVVGQAPEAATRSFYVGLLDRREHSVASLGVLAAETELNLTNIDLIGLARKGLEYIVFPG